MRLAPAFSVKASRHKDPQYKRQHKARRLEALMKDRAYEAKASTSQDRRFDRSLRKVEAAFEGCEVR